MSSVAWCWTILTLTVFSMTGAAAWSQADRQLAQLGPGGAPGVLTATAYDDLPAARMVVEPYDDSDLNLQIKDAFDGALADRRQTASQSGDLELGFETQILQGEFVTSGPSLGNFRARSESGVDLQLNIWSSSQDSVLGGRQPSADTRRASVFHINVELRNNATGELLWQADAYCEILGGDNLRVARSMVPPLIDNLGRTVRDVPFDIQ